MTMSSCWWRGASGIACANDANVNAKASAINLVMLLSLPVTKRNEQIMASELVDLIQIKQCGPCDNLSMHCISPQRIPSKSLTQYARVVRIA